MPTWLIHGVDKQTTEPVVQLMVAENSAAATAQAALDGIIALEVSSAPRGKLTTADGNVDPVRLAAAKWVRSAINSIRWVGAGGCVLSVFMLKTPHLFGPWRPSPMVSLIVMAFSVGLVFLVNRLMNE
jgi:hypothetical protein